MSSPRFFKYRAIDDQCTIHEGVKECNNFEALALSLRMEGLQVITASTTTPGGKLAEDRLEKMKKRLNPNTNTTPPETITLPLSIRLLRLLLNLLFFKRRNAASD